ncbi:choline ABC transporter permease subunit [Burkholderia pseudomallei]|uniref:Glycine-betaine binding ABC transporter permease protein n=12 Tax=pseudomallei group TaxID=111527 RepID=Q63KD5_BURPS|nr:MULTISPECIES: choline ABC transporter permease subunit [Burkholderia]KGW46785.1 choline ABC transporter, permease protein [Burkholderia pseudomallei MSHR684]KGX77906.1 choline ABC transporter, permease protein [Burkholderia pseudomallei MSHR435]AAU46782.1 putative glycine betaine/L-proline ABC transporter, permease protein [Burkholderia mallei ATCC 23344]ABA51407.1 glycine betaine/L-proline ABC transporter, permease protein [Burkholderia pseudomallei 1710b]ABM99115.1 glycine betaine/L-proli
MSELIPLGSWVDQSVHYLLDHDAKTFDAIGRAIEGLAALVEHGLQAVPMWLMMACFIGVGLWRVGWRFAFFTAASLFLIFATGFWDQTVVTLGLTLSSTIVSLVLGIPLGIWAAKSKWVAAIVRPILDLMQTMPAFVYLIPAAMLFGLGRVPGILSTVIFAMPPAVRLTSLGIRHVNREIVEAGQAFGCTPWQLLYKVQFPNALPSIMQGVNQTIMMALSMVIIASMVGAGGLGNDVLASIQRLDIGLGFESGLSVVLLAIILDRITESFGRAPGTARAPLFSGLRQLFGPRSRSPVVQA